MKNTASLTCLNKCVSNTHKHSSLKSFQSRTVKQQPYQGHQITCNISGTLINMLKMNAHKKFKESIEKSTTPKHVQTFE